MSRHITLKTEEGFRLRARADRFSTFQSAFAEIRAKLNFGMLDNDDLTITVQKRPPTPAFVEAIEPYLRGMHNQLPRLTCLGSTGYETSNLILQRLPCNLRGIGGKRVLATSDIIYSNELDQIEDPVQEIGQWISSLSDNGLLFLDYSDFQRSAAILQNRHFAVFERMMVQFMNREFAHMGTTIDVVSVPDGTVRGGRIIVFQKYVMPLVLH